MEKWSLRTVFKKRLEQSFFKWIRTDFKHLLCPNIIIFLNFKSVFITINPLKTKIYTSINFSYIGYIIIQLLARRE